jgi:hypothetical protein
VPFRLKPAMLVWSVLIWSRKPPTLQKLQE